MIDQRRGLVDAVLTLDEALQVAHRFHRRGPRDALGAVAVDHHGDHLRAGEGVADARVLDAHGTARAEEAQVVRLDPDARHAPGADRQEPGEHARETASDSGWTARRSRPRSARTSRPPRGRTGILRGAGSSTSAAGITATQAVKMKTMPRAGVDAEIAHRRDRAGDEGAEADHGRQGRHGDRQADVLDRGGDRLGVAAVMLELEVVAADDMDGVRGAERHEQRRQHQACPS